MPSGENLKNTTTFFFLFLINTNSHAINPVTNFNMAKIMPKSYLDEE